MSRSRSMMRNGFRVAGAVVLCVAVFLLGQFLLDMESAGFGEAPAIWRGFVGIFLMFVGFVCLQAGFGGAMARYAAEEMGPATRMTAENLGMRGAGTVHCTSCGARSREGGRFCPSCGGALPAAG